MNKLLERLEIPKNKINDYKIRFLVKSTDGSNPLEIYRETNSLEKWIAWKYDQDILNRPKVISFVKNYDLSPDYWLYVGTYEVTKKDNFNTLNNCVGYNIKMIGNIKDIGSLNIKFNNKATQMIRNLENVIDKMKIINIKDNFNYNESRVKTKKDWLKILTNKEIIAKDNILEILKFVYMTKNHTSNCKAISNYMNKKASEIDLIISSFGQRILNFLSLPEIENNFGQIIRWNIPFKTNLKKNIDGNFTWELRPELILALEEKYDLKEKYIAKNYGMHLERYKRYSRKNIHDMFSPYTRFISGAGSWGRQGIIRVPDTKNDYIFIVTYKTNQSGHNFNEYINENGILEWQSQINQSLNDNQIQDLIKHDHTKSNIYLFLRKSKKLDYSFLGNLAYISHDHEKEKPVYFKWQILDWDPTLGNISLDEKLNIKDITKKINENDLDQIAPEDFTINFKGNKKDLVKLNKKITTNDKTNKPNKNVDFPKNDEKNTKLGNKGEDVVIFYEQQHLNSIGRFDLASKVMATRNFIGNTAKYDILSYENDGSKKYIEVKTTTGNLENAFYISEREVEFSEEKKDHYYLYRLYNFSKKNKTADLVYIKGPVNRNSLSAQKYICSIKNDEKTNLNIYD